MSLILSVPQPYAWLIVNGDQNVLCVSEPTDLRGEVLIYASENLNGDEVNEVKKLWRDEETWPTTFDVGGIVGKATITDCITETTMEPEHEYWFTWRFGPYGLVLADAGVMPFISISGQHWLWDGGAA